MLPRIQPGWLLIFWCGLAAALVALPIARTPVRHPIRVSGRRRIAGVAIELLIFPVLYALVLEALGRSDIALGALLGAAHGTLTLISAALQPGTGGGRAATRTRAFLARTVYGAVFAFLYVVPAG